MGGAAPAPEERGADMDGAGAVLAGLLTRGELPGELGRDIAGLLKTGRGFTIGVGRKLVVTEPFCLACEERCDISRILPRGIPSPAELFSITIRCIGTMGRAIGRGPITIVPRPGLPDGGIGRWKLTGALITGGNPYQLPQAPGCQPQPKDCMNSQEPQWYGVHPHG
jgi:hypothetical protein